MTDLSAADAARLHRIRHEYVPCGSGAHDLDIHFLLRLLDAKPPTEFVTRQKYLDEVALSGKLSGLVTELNNALIAAEAERDRLKADLDVSVTQHERLYYRIKFAEQSNDRLAAALATAQARIHAAQAHLGAALVHLLPSDDAIISDHVRMAHRALSPATGTGSMPATEKGTGSPASDTGTSGPSGLHPAPAPSDYEAVCGSCGRPTP